MDGKSLYMVIQNLDDYGKPIQHRVKYPKTNIREKECGNCGKRVGVAFFYTDSYNSSGYSHWCKKCCKEYIKEKKEFNDYKSTKEVENLINSDYEKFLNLIDGKE